MNSLFFSIKKKKKALKKDRVFLGNGIYAFCLFFSLWSRDSALTDFFRKEISEIVS